MSFKKEGGSSRRTGGSSLQSAGSSSFCPPGEERDASFSPFVGREKHLHLWSGRERESPSPSLALVSIVFVSLISVQDRSFPLFPLFFHTIVLTLSRGKRKWQNWLRFVGLLNAQEKRY